MFGRPLFREFQEDPFFANQQHIQSIQSTFSNPFGFHNGLFGITDGQAEAHGQQRPARGHRPNNELALFGMFDNDMFGSMFTNMRQMMGGMHSGSGFEQQFGGTNPNCHSFSQSTVMSYSNTGQGAPKVYQATSSKQTAPGGVMETRQSVRDSESGVNKMSIGHHLNERAHIIERSRNQHTGQQDENQEFLNLDDDEADSFDREWRERTTQSLRSIGHRSQAPGHARRHHPAITDGRRHRHRERQH